jgi:serine/threonine protein kinase
MNTNARESHNKPIAEPGLADREIRTCPVCGAKFSPTKDSEFCPVCMLRKAFADGFGSAKSSLSEDPLKPSLEGTAQRFEHYELVTDQDGKPLELGRGAMGITYKAFDIDLRYPVTLKVISERYLGDESARLRFLREARAAASVRHPNVASVFHLGRTGQNYFYAMEFVEGETLEKLILRSGRLEVKLALEIATQVAAGLAAVHKQSLVHRDIKPSNIMVSLEEGGAVIAKIIDLGLAKAVNEPSRQTAISIPGGFVGTPEFASPEQFAGVGVDIRSDLYSLGAMLWEMLTGGVLFTGSPAEVMYQHLHAQLPFEQLQGIPQPLVVLLESLLEKDPARRFQNPSELLNALSTVRIAIDVEHSPVREDSQKGFPTDSGKITPRCPTPPWPKKISIARLPVTGSRMIGREQDIAFLEAARADPQVNIVTVAAWGGVGKSTLINHWLRRLATERYGSAESVFGWSFYRQGTVGDTSSADEFLHATLTWFGDADPRLGTGWEKGERLAKAIAREHSLVVLDGLEPLQHPPGLHEGRLREPSLQALLRELAAYNKGLCVITTRLPIADLADYESSSALRLDLNHLSDEAGAQLLRAMGVKGPEAELRRASEEFHGHCLALTLLGSYLTDAFSGDICCREEVSKHLTHDVRQGAHARKVMASYQSWFGEGPEVSTLRLLGLFDRPADEKALGALLAAPAIPGLTDSLSDLSPIARRTILARLRRAGLLAGEDPHNPGCLDTHPLVREYFGEQLSSQQTDAWRECNWRLYHYYRTLAPQLPDSYKDMEPLFLASICGCHAGLFREVLHEIYIPRIQRGDAFFAGSVLGARGALLSLLAHFFDHGRWGSLVETSVEGQRLTADDKLFLLMQAQQYLTVTVGVGAPEARLCAESAESVCILLDRPRLLYCSLLSQWRYSLRRDKLSATMQIAERVYSLARKANDSALMIGAYRAFASTSYWLGKFQAAGESGRRGVQLWRSGGIQFPKEEVNSPVVICLCIQALSEWHSGEIVASRTTMMEAIAVAKELNDMHGLAFALNYAATLGQYRRDPQEVERSALNLVELANRQGFVHWLAGAAMYRGWARSLSGDTTQGISWINLAINECRSVGAILELTYLLALKAEALYLADRAFEALEAVKEAETLTERSEGRWWCAELHRLRGVFLAALGADEAQIQASFCKAVTIATEQKSISLMRRGEASYAEYRRQKTPTSGGRGLRLLLCPPIA